MAALQACIADLEQALTCCAKIGYPLMLKASWGGGGKGIRKARPAARAPCSSCQGTHVQRNVDAG